MSTTSDGQRSDRDKYRSAKQIVKNQKADIEKLSADNQQLHDDNVKLKHETHEQYQKLAHLEAELLHSQVHGSKGRQVERSKDMDEFQRIMMFLRSSFHFIFPMHENGDIISQLSTIIRHLGEKERSYEELRIAHEKLLAEPPKVAPAPDKPQRPLEETLTRVMKRNEEEMEKMQSELATVRKELLEKENAWRESTTHFDLRLVDISNERNKALADLAEARAQAEDLSKALFRSDKGTHLIQNQKDKEMSMLKDKNNTLSHRERESDRKIIVLQKEIAELKRHSQSSKSKYTPRSQDPEYVKSIENKLHDRNRALADAVKRERDLNGQLMWNKSKINDLEKEKNEGLQQLGRLQEELASKDLELLSIRTRAMEASEVVKQMANKERDAAIQKMTCSMELLNRELTQAKNLEDERSKEIGFLKRSIREMEESTAEQTLRSRQELDMIKEKEDLIATLKSKVQSLEKRIATFDEAQTLLFQQTKVQQQTIETQGNELSSLREAHTADQEMAETQQQQLQDMEARNVLLAKIDQSDQEAKSRTDDSRAGPMGQTDQRDARIAQLERELQAALDRHTHDMQSMARKILTSEEKRNALLDKMYTMQTAMRTDIETESADETESQDVCLDIHRAFAIIMVLEEQMDSMMEEMRKATTAHEEMLQVNEELRQILQTTQTANTWLEEKVERLKRDLERREKDLENKMSELAESKGQCHEYASRADLLDPQIQALKHQVEAQMKINAEQQEQLDGRERALNRLDQARKSYDKVYESKINSLKEELASKEKILNAELRRREQGSMQEMHSRMEEFQASFKQAQRTHELVIDALKDDLQIIQTERDRYKADIEKLCSSLEKAASEIEYRDAVLHGYIEFTEQLQGNPIGLENLRGVQALREKHEEDIAQMQDLKEALDNQGKIINDYSQNVEQLTNRSENYLHQVQNLGELLSQERKTRAKELTQFKTQLANKESAIQALERELSEKMDSWRRKEAALTKGNTAAHGSSSAPATPAESVPSAPAPPLPPPPP